jgi:hypothetical protein
MLQLQVEANTMTGGSGRQISLSFWLSVATAKTFSSFFRNFFSFEKFLNQNEKNHNIERSNKELD